MKVEIKKEAKKELTALDGSIRQQIADDILKLILFLKRWELKDSKANQ